MRTLLVISQVYVPDPAAVGQHLSDLCEEMVRRGWRVVVYAAARGYDEPSVRYPRRETLHGVEIRRLPCSSFGKRSLAVRLAAQLLFLAQAVGRGLFTRSLAAVLVSTSPPFAGAGGSLVSWLRGVPLTWWVMDLNPDQLVATGRIGPRSLPARVFDWMNRVTLRRARGVIALDRFMKERLVRKLPAAADRIRIVPPWPPAGDLTADPAGMAAFRRCHGLEGRFVVMYSGNHALQHPITTVLDAAAVLAAEAGATGEPDVAFVFIGGGAGKREVAARIAAHAANLRDLPYQPRAALADSLSAADLHLVSMGDGLAGIIHPCKIYGVLAVGRPVLFLGPDASHAGEILAGGRLGWRVDHGDVAAAVKAIRAAARLAPEARAAMGDEARALAARRFDARRLIAACCTIVADGPAARGDEGDADLL